MKQHEYTGVLTEDQVRKIISRAVAVEKDSGGITPQDLVGIAAEAGISQHALAVAMGDVLGASERPVQVAPQQESGSSWRHKGMRLFRHYAAGAVGLVFGGTTMWIAQSAHSDVVALLGTCLTFLVGLKLALDNRRSGSHEGFQTENVVLWLAFATGSSVAAGRVDENMLLLLTMPWFLNALLGGLVIWVRMSHLTDPVQVWREAESSEFEGANADQRSTSALV